MLALLVAACAVALFLASPAVAVTLPAGFQQTTVFTGLTNPTVLQFSSEGKIYVAEKSGLIKVFDGPTDTSATVFADLSSEVYNAWDRGLLGMALDPQFPVRPYMYVLYTLDGAIGQAPPVWGDTCPTPPGFTADGCVVGARVARLTAAGDAMLPGSEQVLIEDWCDQFPSHTIGSLAFGPDGKLYVSGGEGASFYFTDYGQRGNPCGDAPLPAGNNLAAPDAEGGALRSQDIRTPGDPTTLDGSILRVDPDTGLGVPGNPFYSATGDVNANRIVAFGVRNPFRFTFRPGTSELWFGDVGWDDVEELNRIPVVNDSVAENFGWPCYEGTGRQGGYDSANLTLCETLYAAPGAVTQPYWTYNHANKVVAGESCATGSSSITGVAFNSATGFPASYAGALFIGDYSRNCIWAMLTGGGADPSPANLITFAAGASSPVDLKISPDGSLYYADFAGGTVKRISYGSGNTPPNAVAAATSPTSGPLPLTVGFTAAGSSDPDTLDTLTYEWDLDGDGAFDDSTSITPSFTYSAAGNYQVTVKATDNHGGFSVSSPVSVTAGGPVATILEPSSNLAWKVGDKIHYSGSAVNSQGQPLGAAALTWTFVLHHCSAIVPTSCHEHPLGVKAGVASGDLDAPDHEYPSYIELRLSVTDGGLTDTKSVNLHPQVVQLTFATTPAGLPISVGSSISIAPFTRTVVVGSSVTVSAPTPQNVGGGTYTLIGWSDAGAASHEIVAPNVDTTYTATYQFTGSAYAAAVGADAPRGYWRLGEAASATTAADSTGHGFSGTYVNGALPGVAGVLGGDPDTAARLDGTNDHVVVNNVTNFVNRSPFSVEAWVKLDVVDGVYRRLVSAEWSDGAGRQGFDIHFNNSYGVTFARWVDGTQIGASDYVAPPTGQWLHLVGTYDGTNLRLYYNGTLHATRSDTRNAKTSTAPLYIGRFPTGGQYVDGDVDEVALYQSALSASRVNAHYQAAGSGGGPVTDTTPPDTAIGSGPSGPVNTTSASFDFTSTEPGSTFTCSLDNAAFTACTSPQAYTALPVGSHTFAVKATDSSGNTDASPATRSWTIDLTAPDTTIDSGPSGTVTTSSATFTYSATETGSSFGCSLDGAVFTACASATSQSYSNLANGDHTFRVRATDAAGNTDFTAATRTWTVSVPPPTNGYSQTVLADAPRAYWRLGEAASATSAVDTSGNGYTGSYVNGALPGAAGAIVGDPNSAVHLDGTNDHVLVNGVTNFPNRSPFTVEAWVKLGIVDGVYRRIVSAEWAGAAGRNGWDIHFNTSYGLTVARWVDGTQIGASNYVAPPTGQWLHVVGTYDGTNLRLYLNGVLQATRTDTRNQPTSTAPLYVGRFTTGGQYVAGDVDEVALFPTALSLARILAHYNAGIGS